MVALRVSQRREAEEAAEVADKTPVAVNADQKEAESSPPSSLPVVKMMLEVMRMASFWLLLLEGSICVTFSCFILANVEAMVQAKGGAGNDISWARQGIVYAVAGCGVTGFLPGMIVAKLGQTRGIPVVLVGRAILAGVFLLLITIGGLTAQYVALFVLGFWRITGFSIIEGTVVGEFVAGYGPILGTVFGMIWTPAGGVSLGVGGWATYLSNQDAKNFTWLASIFCGASILSSLTFAAVYYKQHRSGKDDQLTEDVVTEKQPLLN